MFQHTPLRGRKCRSALGNLCLKGFQHTPLRGRKYYDISFRVVGVGFNTPPCGDENWPSRHCRSRRASFNTPPCGDENACVFSDFCSSGFQHTPLRGRKSIAAVVAISVHVSTHPLAGTKIILHDTYHNDTLFQHTPLRGRKCGQGCLCRQSGKFQHTPLRGRK